MQEAKKLPERWCSTKEVCECLGVRRDTLLSWVNEKNMPACKVGRSWKFKLTATVPPTIISIIKTWQKIPISDI